MDPLFDIDSTGEPNPGDPITSEETQIDPDRLEKLGESLAERRDEWVAARGSTGVEKRWKEDLDQYHGRDENNKPESSMLETVVNGGPLLKSGTKPQRSTVFVNITRPKTNAAEARVAGMLYPSDDKNWGLKPTPVPELAKAMGQQSALGQTSNVIPLPTAAAQQVMQPQQAQPAPQNTQLPAGIAPANPAQTQPAQPLASDQLGDPVVAEANLKAKAMIQEIDDALTECNYNGEGRMMLHDCAVLGTGCLKGPVVVNRTRKSWTPVKDGQGTVHILEIAKEKKPASSRRDIWNLFPDPMCGDNIHDGQGMFERNLYSPKQLRDLAKQPGYIKANIEKVLEEGPQRGVAKTERDKFEEKSQGSESKNSQFEVWEYWGEFEPDDLIAAGVEDITEGSTETLSGCVILVNQKVIKGFLNPIETGDIPYDFMQWEKIDGSCWGYGIPRLIRPAQKVLNAAWRQLMDNSGLSVGPQIVVKRGIIEPADKKWELTGRKIWYCSDESVDVRTAFDMFEVTSHQQELQGIIELALKFADEESAVPMLAQGEKGEAPDTVGGMTILMNSSNVVLQRMVKQFDDQITKPHITRYYDWMMAYSDKPEIKGDFQIDARGTSALLVRDMQSQALIQLGQFQGSPVIAPMVNWENWFKEVLKAQHVDPADIMKTEDEIANLRNQPPTPNPEELKAKTALAVAQIKSQTDIHVADESAKGELAYADKQQQMAAQNDNATLQELQLKRELALLDYANKNQMNLDAVKAELAKTAMIEGTKRQLAQVDQQAAHTEKLIDAHKEIAVAHAAPQGTAQ